MTHEYNKQRPTGIKKEHYTLRVYVFLIKASKAYEVVEAYMHSFLLDFSKLQHHTDVSKYLGNTDFLTQSMWLVYKWLQH